MLILLIVFVLAAGTVVHVMLENAEADNVDTNATSDVVNKTEKEFKPVEASLAIVGLLAVCFLVLRQCN